MSSTAGSTTVNRWSGLLGITVIGAVLTARQSALLTAGDTPLDAFLGGYRAGLLLAAGLVALGGVAAYVGLRRRTAGRHARGNMPAAQAISVPALQGGALQGGMTPAVQPA